MIGTVAEAKITLRDGLDVGRTRQLTRQVVTCESTTASVSDARRCRLAAQRLHRATTALH